MILFGYCIGILFFFTISKTSTAEFQLPVKGADLESAGPLCQFTVAELSGVMSWKAPRFQWRFLPLFVHISQWYKLQSCSTIISGLYFTHENSVKQSHCRNGPIRQICPLKALLQLTGNVSDQVVSKPLIRCISLTLLSYSCSSCLCCFSYDHSPSLCIVTHSAATPIYGVIIPSEVITHFFPPCLLTNYAHILYTPFTELVLMRPLTV